MKFDIIKSADGKAVLMPVEAEGVFYYARLHKRGKHLDCSGVFEFQADEGYGSFGDLTPAFRYCKHSPAKTQRIIKQAKQHYEAQISNP